MPYNHKIKNVLSVLLNKTFPCFLPGNVRLYTVDINQGKVYKVCFYKHWCNICSSMYLSKTSSSVVRAFAHGVMGHQIDSLWWTH